MGRCIVNNREIAMTMTFYDASKSQCFGHDFPINNMLPLLHVTLLNNVEKDQPRHVFVAPRMAQTR